MKKLPLILTVGVATAVSLLVDFFTFVSGRTSGPDFIESIQSGKIAGSMVESVDVFASQVGSMPFRASEYARLQKLAEIGDPSEIKRILENLAKAERNFPLMNHPVDKDVCYLRFNTKTGWYWIYCDLLDDDRSRGLAVRANTLNATNPNGGKRYYLDTEDVILAITKMKK